VQPPFALEHNLSIVVELPSDALVQPPCALEHILPFNSAIVSAPVTLSKYTAKVYTPMTPHQFHLKLQTVERMNTLCARTSVTARSGQHLAPRVGPYAYYYRLFEDFYENIQMECDKLLTQKEYLNDHKFRLIIVPDPPDEPR
jgi:hypothetical protein